jgi:hypothetical protein
MKSNRGIKETQERKNERKPLTKKAKIAIIVVSVLVGIVALGVSIYFIVLAAIGGNTLVPSEDLYFGFNRMDIISYNREANRLVAIYEEDCGIQILDPRGQKFSFGKLWFSGGCTIEDYRLLNRVDDPVGLYYNLSIKDNSAAEESANAGYSAIGKSPVYDGVDNTISYKIMSKSPEGEGIVRYDDNKVCVVQGFFIDDTAVKAWVSVYDKEKGLYFVLTKCQKFFNLKDTANQELVTREMFKPVFNVLEEIMAFYVKDAYGINIYA